MGSFGRYVLALKVEAECKSHMKNSLLTQTGRTKNHLGVDYDYDRCLSLGLFLGIVQLHLLSTLVWLYHQYESCMFAPCFIYAPMAVLTMAVHSCHSCVLPLTCSPRSSSCSTPHLYLTILRKSELSFWLKRMTKGWIASHYISHIAYVYIYILVSYQGFVFFTDHDISTMTQDRGI